MNTIAPTPERIDDRVDGLVLWRFTLADGSTVDVAAGDEVTATTEYTAWQTTKETPTPDPLPAAIAAGVSAALTAAGITTDPAVLTAAAETAATVSLAPSPPPTA